MRKKVFQFPFSLNEWLDLALSNSPEQMFNGLLFATGSDPFTGTVASAFEESIGLLVGSSASAPEAITMALLKHRDL